MNLVIETALTAFPMHGQHKLSSEGYRTRDGHMIEWFGRLLAGRGEVSVVSRPEPIALNILHRRKGGPIAANTKPTTAASWRIPNLRDRQRWWVDSLGAYSRATPAITAPVVTWNPFLAISSAWPGIKASGQPVAFDLLDDWTFHYAFQGIRPDVERAYAALFENATVVTANAEGTAELARRYGRSDVVFLPNGCDPERFATSSTAQGQLTIGYVGKIGKRLDLDLIVQAAKALPSVSFVFAGPILDAEYRQPLESQSNITLLGDVYYDDVPALLQTFDLGWVPHRVGEGEVGGDVIKTYEYRAAGLPVLTTPIAGANSRGLDAVQVVPASDQVEWLRSLSEQGPRIARVVTELPADVRWQGKATRVLELLGVKGTAG